MFSRKRLAYIIIITLIFIGLFFLFNLDHDFLRSQERNQADFIVPSAKLNASWLNVETDPGFLVIGKPQNQSEMLISDHVIETLSLIKVDYRTLDFVQVNDLSGNETLIFIVSDISKAGDLEQIAAYVESGGQAIFAAGISTEADWRYLDPLWGILERGQFSTLSNITFSQGYFPYGELEVNEGFPSYSTTLRLDEASEVLLYGNDQTPLVWTHPYALGRSTMINGTFMESKLSAGILIAAISNTREHSIYPIYGSKTIFLDAIPPLFDGNDENSFKYYGRSAESFVRDRLWAVLLQKAALFDLKLTSSFMAIDKQPFDKQNANQQTFSFISGQIIQQGGEISLSGNHVDLDNLSETRVEQTRSFFENFFPNYNIHAYYPLYGIIDEAQMDTLQIVYPNIDIFRILYEGDQKTQSTGDFGLMGNKIIFPTTTYGYKAEGTQLYTFLSVLTSHGAISHSFDINSLFTVPSSESNWNTLNTSFDQLSDLYFAKTTWLDALTISTAAERVKQMGALSYKTQTEASELTVICKGLTIGQKFMFFSKDEISSAENASYEKIQENYYLIEAHAASFKLFY